MCLGKYSLFSLLHTLNDCKSDPRDTLSVELGLDRKDCVSPHYG